LPVVFSSSSKALQHLTNRDFHLANLKIFHKDSRETAVSSLHVQSLRSPQSPEVQTTTPAELWWDTVLWYLGKGKENQERFQGEKGKKKKKEKKRTAQDRSWALWAFKKHELLYRRSCRSPLLHYSPYYVTVQGSASR